MPIGRLLKRPGAASIQTGEWGEHRYDSDTDSLVFASQDATIPSRRLSHVLKLPLNGTAMHAATLGAFWAIPSTSGIMIERVILDVTTVATGACTLDIGYTATSSVTTSDSLLDGVDVNGAIAVFDSHDPALDTGTNAHAQKGAASKWITIDEKTGDATGLIANLYIYYHAI